MPLKPYTDTPSMTLIVSVQNDGSVAQMMNDLNDALALIEENTRDENTYYGTIDVSGTWRPGDSELEPWDEPFFSAWKKLIAMPGLHQPLATWLGRVMNLVKLSNETLFSCLAEHDTTQFAEVPASLLATADLRYVPIYTQFIKVWDMDHAVSQFEVSQHLISGHGETSETIELAAAMAPWN